MLARTAKTIAHIRATQASASTLAKSRSTHTAALVVIGDEVLTGKVQDKNIYTFARFCVERGVDVSEVSIIGDKYDQIAATLSRIGGTVSYIVTTGGLGPTHDDITYDAVARHFARGKEYELVVDQPTVNELAKRNPLNAARMRMAQFPPNSLVHRHADLWVPVVQTENVFMFPGIPALFEKMLALHGKALFVGDSAKKVLRNYYTNMMEGDLADTLHTCQKSYPHIPIGSYPNFTFDTTRRKEYNVKITVEGYDVEGIEAIGRILREKLTLLDITPDK